MAAAVTAFCTGRDYCKCGSSSYPHGMPKLAWSFLRNERIRSVLAPVVLSCKQQQGAMAGQSCIAGTSD